MFSRGKGFEFTFHRCSICLTFILFAFSDASPPSGRGVVVDVDGERFYPAAMKTILSEIDEVPDDGEYLTETRNYFKYPVKTRLELTDSVTARFRRDDKTPSLTHNGSAKDYMSTYYAQRKAIMDKYKSQRKEIMERLKKTKNLIAESKKLKESKSLDSGRGNATRDRPDDSEPQNPTTADYGDGNSTVFSEPTSSSLGNFGQTTSSPDLEVPIFNSTLFNGSKLFSNSSRDEATDYSTEVDRANATIQPFEGDDNAEIIDGSDLRTLEGGWPGESVNLNPRNEVDFNLSEQSLTRQERGNDTVTFDLRGHPANPSRKNDSALEQLEKMFLWEMPARDEGVSRGSNDHGAAAGEIAADDSGAGNVNIISGDDRSENSNRSSDSLRFIVEIKSSPEVHVTKNIKNVKSSTTTYRNSTHEIVEVNGIVNSTKRINGASRGVDLPSFKNTTLEKPNAITPAAEIGGGARDSEWCEKCPHDYRWGECEGTLFYQHNIFLRNRGPSAIDAIFGMNVEGPVAITCVEAIRFNETRGIVTLHSGGAGYDFAKLRIRGFQGEGFSYIMKVWGVSSEGLADGTVYPYRRK